MSISLALDAVRAAESAPGGPLARTPRTAEVALSCPAGTVRLSLRGLYEGEAQALRPRLLAASRAVGLVAEEAGSVGTTAAEALAYADRLERLGDLPSRATSAILGVYREIARLGVTGWPAGEICTSDGEEITPDRVRARVGGEEREALSERAAAALEVAGLLLEIVRQILALSRAEGDAASPFEEVPHGTPESSPSPSAPPSRSGLDAAPLSAGGQRSAPSVSGRTTAPPAPPLSESGGAVTVEVWP